ncbi:MAG: hypothetical protein AB8C40_06100 [Gammaproteobacteria bacterium]
MEEDTTNTPIIMAIGIDTMANATITMAIEIDTTATVIMDTEEAATKLQSNSKQIKANNMFAFI